MMRKTFQLLACAALLAAPLAFTTPAVADPNDEIESAAPPQTAEHEKFHDQWEQLRFEHESLLAERDRLMERCMDAKGQDKSACDEQWQDLRQRHDAWRERMIAFHDQSMSEHATHKGYGHHRGMKAHHKWKKDGAKHEHHHGAWKHHHHRHDTKKQGMKQPSSEPQNAPAPNGQ